MDTDNPALVNNPEKTDQSSEIIQFLNRVSTLKKLRRTGWVVRDVPNPESIADHIWRVTLMAMLLGDFARRSGRDLDSEKLMRIALVHETGESLLGDLHLHAKRLLGNDCISRAEKQAVEQLCLGLGETGQNYISLWEDFEERRTPEGRFVRGLDKLEMMITAWEYEKAGMRGLSEFFTGMENSSDILSDPLLGDILRVLLVIRGETV